MNHLLLGCSFVADSISAEPFDIITRSKLEATHIAQNLIPFHKEAEGLNISKSTTVEDYGSFYTAIDWDPSSGN